MALKAILIATAVLLVVAGILMSTTLGRMMLFGSATIIGRHLTTIEAGTTRLAFQEPLNAITEGASIVFDISAEIRTEDFLKRSEEAEDLFPEGCVRVVLFDERGTAYYLNRRGFGLTNTSVLLSLYKTGGSIVGPEYVAADIDSCRRFSVKEIRWLNYKK